MSQAIVRPMMTSPPDVVCQIAGHILYNALRRLRCNRYCIALNARDQMTLLDDTWPDVFLLNASVWPVDVVAMMLRVTEASGAPNKVQLSFVNMGPPISHAPTCISYWITI